LPTKNNHIHSIAVIGAGAAGIQACLRAVLNNDDVLLFTGSAQDKKRSRALWVKKIENMPAHFQYARGIVNPNQEVIDWIQNSPFKDKLNLVNNTGVVDVVKMTDHFLLTDHKDNKWLARYLILCTGIMDVQPIINGSIEAILPFANYQTVDYCLRCDGHHVLGHDTAVIGHDDSAAWVAIMLYERYQVPNMTILTHGKEPAFSPTTSELIKKYNFDIQTDEIVEVLGDTKSGELTGFVLCCGQSVLATRCFVSLGIIAYNHLALKLGCEVDERGLVKANENGLTSVAGVYVAGDLKANTRKQIYTAWDNAVSAADAINAELRKARRL